MQTATTANQGTLYKRVFQRKPADCLGRGGNRSRSGWIVEQLGIEPYQHILEVGYGTGNTLQEVGKRLRVGFLAGVDESLEMYQVARQKNKKLLEQQLLQLHIGSISSLPYPSYYFDTVYGNNAHLDWKKPQLQLLQLSRLLKTGGRMVLVFQPRGTKTDNDLWQAAENLRGHYLEADLKDVRISFMEMLPVDAISVIGVKG